MGRFNNDKRKTILQCLLSAGLAVIIFIVIMLVQSIRPFGVNSILRNDAIQQYAPLLLNYCLKIKEGGLSLWSWIVGGGVNEYGLIAYYLLSPFNLIALPFKPEDIDIAFALIILLKTAFIGLCSGYYFQKKNFGNSRIISVAFSLIYTFSGFYVCYYYNTMWLDALMMLPLIALGIENIVNGKKATLYFCSLAYAIFVNFYLGYMLCIFSVLYFFYQLFSQDVSRNADEKKNDEAPIMSVMVKFGLSSLFAGLICAIVIVPVIYSLSGVGNVNNFDSVGQYFNFFDFLSYHLTAVIPLPLEHTNQTGPYLMSSMLTLLCVPAFFFLKNVKKNKKVATIVLLVLFYFSFAVPQMNSFWHGFVAPNMLPYRFSFIYLFFIITIAFETVCNISELPKWALGISALLVISGIINTKYSSFSTGHFDNYTLIVSVVAAVLYIAVITLMNYKKHGSKVLSALLGIIIVAELFAGNYRNIHSLDVRADSLYGFNNNITEAVETAKFQDNDSFVRMEIVDGVYDIPNLPAVYDYNGFSEFSSMSSTNYALAHMNMGNYGNESNLIKYCTQTPIYNAVFGMDYVIDTDNLIAEDNPYYTKVEDFDGCTLYKVKRNISFGLAVSDLIEKWDPYSFVPTNVQSIMWKALTGVEGAFVASKPISVSYFNAKPVSQEEINKYIEEHMTVDEAVNENDESTSIEHDHEHELEEIEGNELISGEKTEMSLSAQSLIQVINEISTMYSFKAIGEGFYVSIDMKAENEGEYYVRINSGSMQTLEIVRADGTSRELDISERHISDLGYFKAGEEFKLIVKNPDRAFEDYDPEYPLSDSIQISVASLNEEKFLEGYNKILENGVLDIDEFEDTHIHGTVNSTIDGYMMMPMPYDLGWTIWVDGEEIEPHEHESHIMMFEITKGQHEIEMKYFPQGLKEGIFVSVAAVLGLVLVLLLGRVHKMKLELEAEEAEKAAEAADGDAQSVSVSAQDEGEADGASPPDSEE